MTNERLSKLRRKNENEGLYVSEVRELLAHVVNLEVTNRRYRNQLLELRAGKGVKDER